MVAAIVVTIFVTHIARRALGQAVPVQMNKKIIMLKGHNNE
jgi:hypothetical protein